MFSFFLAANTAKIIGKLGQEKPVNETQNLTDWTLF